MLGDWLTQWLLMLSESLLLGLLLIGLFALRHRFGMPLFYLTLGVLQYLQVALSATLNVPLLPGVLVNPGSAVLFTAGLSMVLLVHLREGPAVARQLLYGLVLANVAVGMLSVLFGLHLNLDSTQQALNVSTPFLQQSPRIMLIGSIALLVDGILLLVLYELLGPLRHWPILRILLCLAIVLVVDSVLFIGGAFTNEPGLGKIMFASAFGKVAMAPVFAGLIVAYLRLSNDSSAQLLANGPRDVSDVYQFMTYREKYEAVRSEMELDALTRAYSRRYFDVRLPHYIEIAKHRDTALSLLMVDVDHFKRLNDTWGHQAGDQVLKIVSLAAKDAVRAGDRVCRYGGEEFGIIVIGANAELATTMAERIRKKVKNALVGELEKVGPLTVSIGVATYPQDGQVAEQLVAIADERLYQAKDQGRDRVVAGNAAESED